MKRYKALLAGSLLAIGCMTALVASINEKKEEQGLINTVPKIDRWETRNEEYKKVYPRQYDSWKQTKNSDDIEDLLKKYPELVVLYAGYGFAKDYNSPRGHFYAVEEIRNTLRTGAPKDTKTGPMPSACWTCKSPDVPRIMNEQGDLEYFTGKFSKYGTEIVNPLGCVDCHNPETMELSVNRQYLDNGLKAAGETSLADAKHQDMRSLVCAQCHVEYYFDKQENPKGGKAAVVTLPWSEGTSVEDMEKYYDNIDFKDWTHKVSKTPMLKAQHPGWEMWKTGAHGKNNVSCADCHMPYKSEGGIKYTDHNIGNPLDNMEYSCMNCHRTSEESLLSNINEKKKRKDELHKKNMKQIAAAHLEAGKAWEVGATKEEMAPILKDIRHAQWRWDYAVASHAAFFHAPEETLRILGSALEKAGNARIKLAKILAKYEVSDYKAPKIYSKEQAQEITGLPFDKLIEDKKRFKGTLLMEWKKHDPEYMKTIEDKTSYD